MASHAAEDLYVVVHPGHGMLREDLYDNFGNFWSVPGLRTEDYLRYAAELDAEFGRRVVDDTPVAVLYRQDYPEESCSFLGSYTDAVDLYVSTSNLGAHPTDAGETELAALVDQVPRQGTVRVAGELNGLCHSQAVDIVTEMVGERVVINDGRVFPDQPLKNVGGQVYWEDAFVPRRSGRSHGY